MKKLLFLSLSVLLCAASPKPHAEKIQDLKKMDIEQLEDYRIDQEGRCQGEGIYHNALSEKQRDEGCNNSEKTLQEIKKRGYIWGPEKGADGTPNAEADKCWIMPDEKHC